MILVSLRLHQARNGDVKLYQCVGYSFCPVLVRSARKPIYCPPLSDMMALLFDFYESTSLKLRQYLTLIFFRRNLALFQATSLFLSMTAQ